MASENDSVVSMETSQEAASEKPNGRSVKFIEDGDDIDESSKLYTEGLDEVTINNEPEVQIEIQKFEAPDGGFGWVIVFCSFMVHFIIGGIERSSGLLYLQFRERYNQSATASAWLLAVASGVRLMLGPVVSAISERFSCRAAVMWGGFITCVSMVISGFSPSLYYLFLSFGLLGGIGRSLAYCPAVVIVGYYFHKKRGKAVGIATSGVGFGTFVIPLVIELVFNYYLFTGAFLIIAGIAFNLSLTGSLMRPLSVHRKIQDIEKRKKEGLLSPPPEIEKRVHQLEHVKRNDNNLYDSIDFTIPVLKGNASVRKNSSFSNMKRRLSSVVTFSKFRQSKGKETKKKKLFEFSLLRDFRFSCFCVAILLFTVAFQAAFTFLPAYIKQIGGSDTKAAFSIVIAGVMDGVGRIASGFILDFKRVKPYRLYVYNSVMFLVGAVSFIIPNLTDFLPLAITCGIYGFLIGLYISQKSVVIVDLLGPEKLNFSFGIMILFQGIGMFTGPTIGGLLKDINGKYDASFYFGGSAMYLGAIILVISNTYHYLQQKKEKT